MCPQSVRYIDALDFMVIGAQKAGTTALFHYLSRHPEIFIPDDKEAPFFSRQDRYERGLSWYLGEYFSGVGEKRLAGTVSPQYLCSADIPERIASAFPSVRMIAILRDPISRATSHYRMLLERGLTNVPLEEAFWRLLDPDVASRARMLEPVMANEAECVLVWGEYGRVLSAYLQQFSRDQLLLLPYEDLREHPEESVRRVFGFLGASTEFTPDNLGVRYFESARDPLSGVRRVLAAAGFRRLWRAIPNSLRYRVRHDLERILRRTARSLVDDQQLLMSDSLRARLLDYYREDVAHLVRIAKQEFPWALQYLPEAPQQGLGYG